VDGSEHGGAYLDVTHRGADYIRRKLPSMYDQFLHLADVDITKERMEVAPTIHYAMGGIAVESETAATNVAGLYAAGECAAGLHGANRLGGNSLSDLLVFGRRAGEAAAEYVRSMTRLPLLDERQVQEELAVLLRPFENAGQENYLYAMFSADGPASYLDRFRASVRERDTVADTPRRTQDRAIEVTSEKSRSGHSTSEERRSSVGPEAGFRNEPDTDP